MPGTISVETMNVRIPVSCLLIAVLGCNAPDEKAYEPLGSRPIRGNVRAADYVLVGCWFSPGEGLSGHLALERPLRRSGDAALAELDSILEALEAGRAPKEEPSGFLVYELSVSRRWILDLWIEDACDVESSLKVRARGAREELFAEAKSPRLAWFLRSEVWKALRAAMTRPRVPAPWQYAAVAKFLSLDAAGAVLGLDSEARRALLAEILEFLASARDPAPLVFAALPILREFRREDLARFAHAEDISLRVLALAREAAEGDRRALDEIFRLSLEFFGRDRLFAAAFAALFSRGRNPDLWKRHPAPSRSEREAAAFLKELRSEMASAEFAPPEGWGLGIAGRSLDR